LESNEKVGLKLLCF